MKVLLIGADGQLGTDLLKTNPGHNVKPLVIKDLDITNPQACLDCVKSQSPQVVINTAAYNRTDDAESFPEEAFRVNILGPRFLARACAGVGARLVHYSSDFVFDGKKKSPYVESDPTAPLSVYGFSKLGGEVMVLNENEQNIILRTASLFGTAGSLGKGGNFIEAIIARSREGLPVEVVEDIVMSPTYALDLATLTWALLDRQAPGGVYHAANGGQCSWFEFAREVFDLLKISRAPLPVRSAERFSRIRRPPRSAMASERLPLLRFEPLRPWREALRAYLTEKGYLS